MRSRLDETMLKKLAAAGGGVATNLSQGNGAIAALKSQLDRLEKREMEVRSFSDFESYYQWFLLPAILLLVVEQFVFWKKKN